MKTESVSATIDGLKEAGINFISSLPSKGCAPLIERIMKDVDFIHVPVANEEDAIAICAGASVVGKKTAFVTPAITGYGVQVPRILESFQVPYIIVRQGNKLIDAIVRGQKTVTASGKPAAVLLSGEAV